MLPNREPAHQKADHHRRGQGDQRIDQITAEEQAEAPAAQGRAEGHQPGLLRPLGQDLPQAGRKVGLVRLLRAGPAGKGVQAAELRKIDAGGKDPADLRADRSVRSGDGGLDVGGDDPDIQVGKAVADREPIQRVVHAVRLAAAFDQRLARVQDQTEHPLAVKTGRAFHKAPPFSVCFILPRFPAYCKYFPGKNPKKGLTAAKKGV